MSAHRTAQNEDYKEAEESEDPNLGCLHLRPSLISPAEGKSEAGLVVDETQLLHLSVIIAIDVSIGIPIGVRIGISIGVSICISVHVLVGQLLLEPRAFDQLGHGLLHGCQFSELIRRGSVGMDTGNLQYLFRVDGAAGFDPGRVRVLLVIALGLDDNVEDGIGILDASDHMVMHQCHPSSQRCKWDIRRIKSGSEVVQERRDVDDSGFGSKNGLLHAKKGCC